MFGYAVKPQVAGSQEAAGNQAQPHISPASQLANEKEIVMNISSSSTDFVQSVGISRDAVDACLYNIGLVSCHASVTTDVCRFQVFDVNNVELHECTKALLCSLRFGETISEANHVVKSCEKGFS